LNLAGKKEKRKQCSLITKERDIEREKELQRMVEFVFVFLDCLPTKKIAWELV
jgi:hypothetical protein